MIPPASFPDMRIRKPMRMRRKRGRTQERRKRTMMTS